MLTINHADSTKFKIPGYDFLVFDPPYQFYPKYVAKGTLDYFTKFRLPNGVMIFFINVTHHQVFLNWLVPTAKANGWVFQNFPWNITGGTRVKSGPRSKKEKIQYAYIVTPKSQPLKYAIDKSVFDQNEIFGPILRKLNGDKDTLERLLGCTFQLGNAEKIRMHGVTYGNKPEKNGPVQSKPLQWLMALLLIAKATNDKGKLIFDPFAGSGSVGLLARSKGLELNYIGCEIEEESFEGIRKSFKQSIASIDYSAYFSPDLKTSIESLYGN